jgi:hypothetical protein
MALSKCFAKPLFGLQKRRQQPERFEANLAGRLIPPYEIECYSLFCKELALLVPSNLILTNLGVLHI